MPWTISKRTTSSTFRLPASVQRLQIASSSAEPACWRYAGTSRLPLLRTLYPAALIQEHLAGRANDIIGKKVSQVEADYCNTLTFPMLMTHSVFHDAIHGLVEQGNVIGLRHPADNTCGRRPRLNADQLGEAVVSEPFDVSSAPRAHRRPRQV